MLPFCCFQRQRCIEILCPKDPDFYTPLVLKTAKGQHLPALEVYKNQSFREWPRYCRKEYWTKMVQNGPNDHFGQNDLIPNWILAFARPKWTKMVHFGPFWPEEVHFGPFRSANRTLAIPDHCESKIVARQSQFLPCETSRCLAGPSGWFFFFFKGGFGGSFPCAKNRNEGTFGCSPVPKPYESFEVILTSESYFYFLRLFLKAL